MEAERQASKEEENKASEEYIQRLLAEEEEEEKRRTERRRSEMEEQLRGDEELARRLSTSIFQKIRSRHKQVTEEKYEQTKKLWRYSKIFVT